eukprot:TRINITY_DN7460_c0_g1_i1.p2 TRINITY_DN7460_c0_g1~~TRINITY_DN7460_c0_g1_i1.p2  ORF type:complete len:115 (-),score=21.90 TRINITY_DN7460_c0_g1_i1:138-482(-)
MQFSGETFLASSKLLNQRSVARMQNSQLYGSRIKGHRNGQKTSRPMEIGQEGEREATNQTRTHKKEIPTKAEIETKIEIQLPGGDELASIIKPEDNRTISWALLQFHRIYKVFE